MRPPSLRMPLWLKVSTRGYSTPLFVDVRLHYLLLGWVRICAFPFLASGPGGFRDVPECPLGPANFFFFHLAACSFLWEMRCAALGGHAAPLGSPVSLMRQLLFISFFCAPGAPQVPPPFLAPLNRPIGFPIFRLPLLTRGVPCFGLAIPPRGRRGVNGNVPPLLQ